MDNMRFSHGGNIYKVNKGVLDFSANINPLGLPQGVKKNIFAEFDKVLHYPDPAAERLIKQISRYWGIAKDNILLGNGSVELMYLIMNTFTPSTVSIPVPCFSEYERAACTVNSRLLFIPLKQSEDFRFDYSRVKPCDMLIAGNPNNPSGNLLFTDKAGLFKLPVKKLVVDEAFMDFLPDERSLSLVKKACVDKKLLILRTFTKFFAMPGLRIGYMVAHKEIIKKLKRLQVPWNTNVIAQIAAEDILQKRSFIKATRRLITEEGKFLFDEVNKISAFCAFPSRANFLLLKIKDKKLDSADLVRRLIAKAILVRDCSNFRGLNNKFIRVAVRTRKENIKLLKALRSVS